MGCIKSWLLTTPNPLFRFIGSEPYAFFDHSLRFRL
jgi:hypothetical protein